MRSIDCLIFDLDGTLIDSSDGVVDAVNYSLRMMGQPEQPPERIKRYIGFPLSQMYPEFTGAPVEKLSTHFQDRAAKSIVPSTIVLDGVDDALRTLRRRGYRMAIATTKIRRHVEGIVAKLGWADLFEILVGSDDVTNVKPAPDAFRLVLRRLRVSSAKAVVIGDTVNDVQAAHAVPMKVIAVVSPFGDPAEIEAAKPDYLIKTMSELPALLDKINK